MAKVNYSDLQKKVEEMHPETMLPNELQTYVAGASMDERVAIFERLSQFKNIPGLKKKNDKYVLTYEDERGSFTQVVDSKGRFRETRKWKNGSPDTIIVSNEKHKWKVTRREAKQAEEREESWAAGFVEDVRREQKKKNQEVDQHDGKTTTGIIRDGVLVQIETEKDGMTVVDELVKENGQIGIKRTVEGDSKQGTDFAGVSYVARVSGSNPPKYGIGNIYEEEIKKNTFNPETGIRTVIYEDSADGELHTVQIKCDGRGEMTGTLVGTDVPGIEDPTISSSVEVVQGLMAEQEQHKEDDRQAQRNAEIREMQEKMRSAKTQEERLSLRYSKGYGIAPPWKYTEDGGMIIKLEENGRSVLQKIDPNGVLTETTKEFKDGQWIPVSVTVTDDNGTRDVLKQERSAEPKRREGGMSLSDFMSKIAENAEKESENRPATRRGSNGGGR